MRPHLPQALLPIALLAILTLPATGSAQDTGWQDKALADAVAFHRANLPETCEPLPEEPQKPVGYELQIGEDTAARQALLVEFPCRLRAQSQSSVYLMSDERGTITEVLFPSPSVEVRYADGTKKGAVESITITETRNVREVINAQYDKNGRTMVERDAWPEGQAYTTTSWGYRDGRFQIMHFAVDASFDGIDNPQTLIENDIW